MDQEFIIHVAAYPSVDQGDRFPALMDSQVLLRTKNVDFIDRFGVLVGRSIQARAKGAKLGV